MLRAFQSMMHRASANSAESSSSNVLIADRGSANTSSVPSPAVAEVARRI